VQLLANLLHKPVVTVDNVPYHNRKKEKLPTKAREEYIQEWLTRCHIPFKKQTVKKDIL
jgi:hypothetical protein